MLVKEGHLDVTINGVTTRVGPGAIVFASSGDLHGWQNVGDTNAVYYVIRLKTEATPGTVAQN